MSLRQQCRLVVVSLTWAAVDHWAVCECALASTTLCHLRICAWRFLYQTVLVLSRAPLPNDTKLLFALFGDLLPNNLSLAHPPLLPNRHYLGAVLGGWTRDKRSATAASTSQQFGANMRRKTLFRVPSKNPLDLRAALDGCCRSAKNLRDIRASIHSLPKRRLFAEQIFW